MKKSVSKFKNSERGVTLCMALLILSAVLAMSAAIMSLMIGEFKISGDVQKSMMAIYAADAGLEAALYETRKNNNFGRIDCSGLGALSCSVSIDSNFTSDPPCNTGTSCTQIKSTGTNSGFNRKIQASYLNK